jgi:hypothetical protein
MQAMDDGPACLHGGHHNRGLGKLLPPSVTYAKLCNGALVG